MSKRRTEREYLLSEEVRKLALEQFKAGKPLFGRDGAFAPLLKEVLEASLEGEMAVHLKEESESSLEQIGSDDENRKQKNRRNGLTQKMVKSSEGMLELSTPRDRNGTFTPEIVKKRQTILADNLEDKILGMYGLGMSLRDISKHIEDMYDTPISANTLSEITDRIIPSVIKWQSRPLEGVYAIVWLDAMYYKVKDDTGQMVTRCVYNILGVNLDGSKQVLGAYVSQSEGAKFWLNVLTDLQNRGVKDILIACIDNLSGFEEAIKAVFPLCEIQSCIVHQMRNTYKYVASKDIKTVMKELKAVYSASSKEAAELALDEFEAKWDKKYPSVIKSWRTNWDKLSTFFNYSESIRKLIYTTNTIEGYHRQIRKVTKTKGGFTSDMALLKLIYLSSTRIEEKWGIVRNWPLIYQQLEIKFGDRLKSPV
jgi:transposase-like protein